MYLSFVILRLQQTFQSHPSVEHGERAFGIKFWKCENVRMLLSSTNTNGEIAGNGGQIIKECLKSGMDVNRFRRKHDDTDERKEHIIRKKRRGTGGEITVPTEVSPEKLRQMAKEKIQSGEYTIGQRIVPKKVCNL